MVKKIIWSQTAKVSKTEILEYWNKRNNSKVFSQHLDMLLHRAVKAIVKFPTSGKLTNEQSIRIKIVRDYLIFYSITPDEILILLVWDGRRNSEDLPWQY